MPAKNRRHDAQGADPAGQQANALVPAVRMIVPQVPGESVDSSASQRQPVRNLYGSIGSTCSASQLS